MIELQCSQCRQWLPDWKFGRKSAAKTGRKSACSRCSAFASAARRAASKQQRELPQKCMAREEQREAEEFSLPTTSLIEQLECVRLRKWARSVETNPRFGVAMIKPEVARV